MNKFEISSHFSVFKLKTAFAKISSNFLLKSVFFTFVIIAFAFNESGYMPYLGLTLGLFFIYKGPQFLLRIAGKFPPEITLLNIWFIWTLITGLIVAKDHSLFYSGIRSLFLMISFVNLLFIFLSYDNSLIKLLLLALFLTALINFFGIELGLQPEEFTDKERLYGITSNPNSLGIRVVYSSFVLLLAFPRFRLIPSFKNILLIVLLAIFISLIIASASRKSLISFLFLLTGFLLIINANKNEEMKFSTGMLVILFIFPLFTYFGDHLLEGTVMEERFYNLSASGGLTKDIRYSMVTFGLELTAEHPIFGVGLNNYRAYSPWGMYSHNDYIESLTSTGIVGFVLYQSIGIITIIRTLRLLKTSINRTNRFYFAMIILGILMLKLVGLGQIIYSQPTGMILMTALASYTWIIQKALRKNTIYI